MFGRRLFSIKNSIKRTRKGRSKKDLSAQKTKNNNLLAGIVAVLIVGVLAVVGPLGYLFLQFEPNDSYGSYEGERWNYRGKFKILLIGVDRKEGGNVFVDGLVLLSVHPENGEVSLININPDILLYPDGGDRPTTLRRGLLEGEGDVNYLADLSEELLATKIDRYVLLDKNFFGEIVDYSKSIEVSLSQGVVDPDLPSTFRWEGGTAKVPPCCVYEYLSSDNNGRDEQLHRQLELYREYTKNIDMLKALLGLRDFLGMLESTFYTNLSKSESVMLVRFLRSVPPGSYNLVYTDSGSLNKIGKAGIYDVFAANYPLLDRQIDRILRDKDVQLEQAIIEVQNASGVGGLATKKARWMSNIGAEIAHVANAPYPEERTKIYIEDFEQYPNTIKQMKRIFGSNVDFIESEYQYRHIGKIVVVIGKEN